MADTAVRQQDPDEVARLMADMKVRTGQPRPASNSPILTSAMLRVAPQMGCPEGWSIEYSSTFETPYYFNPSSGESSWTSPVGAAKAATTPTKSPRSRRLVKPKTPKQRQMEATNRSWASVGFGATGEIDWERTPLSVMANTSSSWWGSTVHGYDEVRAPTLPSPGNGHQGCRESPSVVRARARRAAKVEADKTNLVLSAFGSSGSAGSAFGKFTGGAKPAGGSSAGGSESEPTSRGSTAPTTPAHHQELGQSTLSHIAMTGGGSSGPNNRSRSRLSLGASKQMVSHGYALPPRSSWQQTTGVGMNNSEVTQPWIEYHGAVLPRDFLHVYPKTQVRVTRIGYSQ